MEEDKTMLIMFWVIGVIGVLEVWFLDCLELIPLRNLVLFCALFIFFGLAIILIIVLLEYINKK